METLTALYRPEDTARDEPHLKNLGGTMLDGFNQAIPQPSNEIIDNTAVTNREIPGMPPGLFNAGVWEHTTEHNGEEVKQVLLLGRLPQEAGAPGEGDPGPIVLCVMQDGAVVSTQELWRPEADNKKGDQLEDARVVTMDDGTVFIGFTRLVYSEADHRHHPFPAIAFTASEDLLAGNFPDTYLIDSFGEGEDTTPLEEPPTKNSGIYGKNATPLKDREFLFRQEDHNHALTLVSLDANNKAKLEQVIDFPQDQIPWWAQHKLGTTMPPVWLNKTEALFIVHGFTIIDGKPNYAVGSARLTVKDGKYTIDNVSADPLLTPQGLTDELFPGQEMQLHPEERVAMYMCGGVVEKDDNGNPARVRSYVSIGDRVTVESAINVSDITSSWPISDSSRQYTAIAA